MFDTFLTNPAVQTVIQAIVNLRWYLYGFAALGALIALRALLRARKDRARAMFGLEREAASERIVSALFTLLLMLVLAGMVYTATNYMTSAAVTQRADARAQAQATATAQARATERAVSAAATAAAPTVPPTRVPPTATPAPTATPTEAPPPAAADLSQTCHGEGPNQGIRYVDRQGVNLRRTPEFGNDNIERVLTLNSEVCVYGEQPAQNDTWLKVTVAQSEGYRYLLKSLTRQ